MKQCTYCGKEYPDELESCPVDAKPLQHIGEPPLAEVPATAVVTPAADSGIWERLTLRQLGVVVVRLQAVWMFFSAMVDLTYLPRYFERAGNFAPFFSTLTPAARLELFLHIIRLALHVAGAVLLICYAEKILLWLVREAPKPAVTEKA